MYLFSSTTSPASAQAYYEARFNLPPDVVLRQLRRREERREDVSVLPTVASVAKTRLSGSARKRGEYKGRLARHYANKLLSAKGKIF